MSILGDARLQAIVDRLQAASRAQEAQTNAYFAERIKAGRLGDSAAPPVSPA